MVHSYGSDGSGSSGPVKPTSKGRPSNYDTRKDNLNQRSSKNLTKSEREAYYAWKMTNSIGKPDQKLWRNRLEASRRVKGPMTLLEEAEKKAERELIRNEAINIIMDVAGIGFTALSTSQDPRAKFSGRVGQAVLNTGRRQYQSRTRNPSYGTKRQYQSNNRRKYGDNRNYRKYTKGD